jgi:PilZ domain
MNERRQGNRYPISFPIRIKWKNENGEEITEDGLTENVGPQGTLIYLPRLLPTVGSKVNLTVTEEAANQISVTAQVIRLERNVAHPQCALMVVGSTRDWEKKVWKLAGEIIAKQKPEEFDDWN